jgi:hypothetical protein
MTARQMENPLLPCLPGVPERVGHSLVRSGLVRCALLRTNWAYGDLLARRQVVDHLLRRLYHFGLVLRLNKTYFEKSQSTSDSVDVNERDGTDQGARLH